MAGPVAATPEAPAGVSIELGPDTNLYPEGIRPAETPPPAQESEQAAAPPSPPEDAGSEEAPKEGEPKGSRRQKGEDAYQRGLREGREAAEKARTERETGEAREKATADEQARIRQLFRDLRSPEYDTRTKAGDEISNYEDLGFCRKGEGAQFVSEGRSALGGDMPVNTSGGLKSFGQLEGVGDEGHQSLLAAKTPTEFAETAFKLGQKHAKSQADEKIAELEAQLEAERGKHAARSLSPERSNGSNGAGARLTLEQYQRMSPAEVRKAGITSVDIDLMTAELMQEAERARR